MKRTALLGASLAIFSLMNFSCSKDDGPSGEVKNNYLTVKIDGVDKTFAVAEARWTEGGNILSMTGTNQGKESIMISVLSETTRVPAGQYSLDDATAFTILSSHMLIKDGAQVNSSATRNTVTKDDSFNLKIDKIDNGSVEGSFSGVLARVQGLNTLGKVSLAGGKFKLAIQPN